jgi:hypothetical protein
MKAKEFEKISMRARVAYGICCLENAIKYYNLSHLSWTFILNVLWSYTNKNVGRWHELMSECSPDSILEELSFKEKGITHISENDYEALRLLYSNVNTVCQNIINSLFNIGTRNLYSSIVNNSPETLIYLQEIIDIMDQNNIPLPDIKPFMKFPITEEEGWGREFTREEILNENNI